MAIDPEDALRPGAPPRLRDLEPMSIEELHDYIVEMETEIARVRETIAAKEKQRNSAETFFRR